MIALLQRVQFASVEVDGQVISRIQRGILAFIGVEKNDTEARADRLLDRMMGYRIFPDSDDKMNLSVKDVQGGLLLVSQFTLAANTKKGMRPSFSEAQDPVASLKLFNYLVTRAKAEHSSVEAGQFGASMQVTLCNDGPVTFLLRAGD